MRAADVVTAGMQLTEINITAGTGHQGREDIPGLEIGSRKDGPFYLAEIRGRLSAGYFQEQWYGPNCGTCVVEYQNADGRMFDEGVGDEARREFDSYDDAAAYIFDQAVEIQEIVDDTKQYPMDIDAIISHGKAMDPRDNGYRWMILDA